MKKLFLLLPLLTLGAIGVQAQGYVLESNVDVNIPSPWTDVPIYDALSGLPLGSSYYAQLYAGVAGINNDSLLTAVDAVDQYHAFLDAAPGDFLVGEVMINGVAVGATATLQVRVWPVTFASWAAAYSAALHDPSIHVGKSALFQQVLGAAGSNTAIAANPGFVTFTISSVPEPSAIGLGLLGFGMLLARRRR